MMPCTNTHTFCLQYPGERDRARERERERELERERERGERGRMEKGACYNETSLVKCMCSTCTWINLPFDFLLYG